MVLNIDELEVNYQQQPVLRFVDFLTNQIILFILEPFNLHKYDRPNRAAFQYDNCNFTQ